VASRIVVGLLLGVGLVLPNRAAHATATHGIKRGGAVTIVSGPQSSYTRNFNPFNSNSASIGDLGFIYEPLLRFNLAKGGKITPPTIWQTGSSSSR
jgi:hypothetical protein